MIGKTNISGISQPPLATEVHTLTTASDSDTITFPKNKPGVPLGVEMIQLSKADPQGYRGCYNVRLFKGDGVGFFQNISTGGISHNYIVNQDRDIPVNYNNWVNFGNDTCKIKRPQTNGLFVAGTYEITYYWET